VVDVGCGQGASTRLLIRLGVQAIGVDIDAYAGARAAPFVAADAARLPFADGSFDGLLTECVLSALADPKCALDEWARVLKPGGCLALSDVYSRAGVETARIRTGSGLARDLVEAGFRIERFEDRSEALIRWVAEFVFGYGSLDALCGGAVDRVTLGQSRPGYCLLIAQKPAAHSEDPRHG
jgi:SAM-dependent methyltransferase